MPTRPVPPRSLRWRSRTGEILCAAGYILANQSETPDIWVSVWVAAKGHNGVGLELMDACPGF